MRCWVKRTLAELLRSFDQVSADQVRAEAEFFQPRPDPRALRGPGRLEVSSRCSLGGKAELSVRQRRLHSDGCAIAGARKVASRAERRIAAISVVVGRAVGE